MKDFNKRVPKNYYEPCSQQGTIEEVTYPSKVYCQNGEAVTKRALVYLPYGYEQVNGDLKVLYLMHGGGGHEEEFLYGQDNAHALIHILDHMIADGVIDPIVVVTPSFYYSDSQSALHDIREAGILTKFYHNEFRNDLLPCIESKYRVRKDREGRAFGGFSMGGETTWEIFLNCLDLVRNYIPLSGDCWILEEKGSVTKAKETVAAMAAYRKDKGFDAYDYNIFAATGDQDIAFPALDAQMKEMFAQGWDGNGNRVQYVSWAEGVHWYPWIYEYIYNDLSEVLSKD